MGIVLGIAILLFSQPVQAISSFYGYQNSSESTKLEMAPQVRLEVALRTISDQLALGSSRIFLGDIFECDAPASICHEVQAVDLGAAPEPGMAKVIDLEHLTQLIEADLGERFDIYIEEGPQQIRLTGKSLEVNKQMIIEQLMSEIEPRLQADRRVQIKNLYVQPGIKVYPGDLSWEFNGLDQLIEEVNEVQTHNAHRSKEVELLIKSHHHGVASQFRIKVRLRLAVFAKVFVARSTLPYGDIVRAEKFTEEWQEVKGEPIFDLESALGKRLTRRISRGQYLHKSDVQEPFLVERGQTVDVILMAGGLQLRSQAKALTSGRLGQSVPVQLLGNRKRLTGQVISSSTVKVIQ